MKKFINEKGNFTLYYFSTYAFCTSPNQRWSGLPLFRNFSNGDSLSLGIALYKAEQQKNGEYNKDTWVKELVVLRGRSPDEVGIEGGATKQDINKGVWPEGWKYSDNWLIEVARFPYTDDGADQVCEFVRKNAREKKMKQHAAFPHLWKMAY
ncbi:TPA: hypothetical protein ACU3FO_004533 [Salmonella enterica]|nr:hypothetical protein [Salmonella enterica]ELO7938204.1 hypothetical protein [Salmonella enterica]HAK8439482.1 hypothetical protein [Salmonella enterica]